MKYSGTTVSIEMLPAEVRHPLSRQVAPNELVELLQTAGTLELDGNDLRVGVGPDYGQQAFLFLACDRLSLLNGARIITNGNTIVILCNTFESEGGGILAFLPEYQTAESGLLGRDDSAPGGPGAPGESGGHVSIHILQKFIGTLHVDLSAQDGGDGGGGGVGRSGGLGAAGLDSWTKVTAEGYPPVPCPRCVRAAQPGHKGRSGLPGGNGGNGGSGGHGGILEIYHAGQEPISDNSVTLVARRGRGGAGGVGGCGGKGGAGGAGGRGSFSCHGAPNGAEGDAGSSGSAGEPGVDGGEGCLIMQHLTIEQIIKSVLAK